MEIRSLVNTDFETIYKAFEQAFSDYEVHINDKELRAMMERRGFDGSLSFAAFEGDEIVAFTLNGVGHFNHLKTAYDTGTGTIKEYRGKGLATQIFEYSLPFLKQAGTQQYLLEVLQQNHKAISVYQNIGFEISREFYYFVTKNEEIQSQKRNLEGYMVQAIEVEDLKGVEEFWDFEPSWQNNFESIFRARSTFIILGVFIQELLVAYIVFDPSSGDIAQFAVKKTYRRRGIASMLFHEMQELNQSKITKLINVDIHCHSLVEFLQSKNISISGKQYEMIDRF